MPRIAAVRREDWDTAVRVGQVWRHRWTNREARVTGVVHSTDLVVLQHPMRETRITGHHLHRDYRLVTP